MNIRQIENEVLCRNVVPADTIICSMEYIGVEGNDAIMTSEDVEWMKVVFHAAAMASGAKFVGEKILTGREIADADRAAGVETLVGVVMRNKKYLIQYAY